ncbi:unnamed protein product [Nippostrongylus brasiliensis]|uniref:Transcriptional regulator n=1 Tax=Nippostrongylus brasiliensis TaxID=27835 RepID=A0A0N4Y9T8_NIPBR|nr:hypothetical protein Q1695_004380 [Nippostrongylus brasiliensis]VDL76697.1 unnamed protein product [Nippostrongylus brasiliensis]
MLRILQEAIADECNHKDREFYYLIEDAHDMHEEYLELMVGDLDGHGKKALALADKFVVAVPNATEEQELLTALKNALQAELSAFVQVKADCFELDHKYDGICEELYIETAFVITELINATIMVYPDGSKKNEVEEIFSKLAEPELGSKNAVHAVGKEILAII